MDHHVELTLIVPVHLDEVVAAPQSADALFRPEQVHMAGAAQLLQVDLVQIAVGLGAYVKAGGDLFIDQLIQLLQLHVALPDADGLHAAADVHPHQVGHYFVGDGHGGADGAARPGVYVRHEADAAARGKLLVAKLDHLGDGCLVHYVGEDLCLIVFSGYF